MKGTTVIIFLIFLSSTAFGHVGLTTPVGGEVYAPGDIITIVWDPEIAHPPTVWHLSYSSNGGSTWDIIEENIEENILTYSWIAPDIESTEMRIKVEQDNETYTNYEDQSTDFVITSDPDYEPEEIVMAIDDFDQSRIFTAYPNPFRSVVNFELRDEYQNQPATIEIYSLSGVKVANIVFDGSSSQNDKLSWHPKALEAGIYLCRYRTQSTVEIYRLIYDRQ